jgi:hypothetical protein
MIKLMDLLLEVKLSPDEQEQYQQALAVLKDETLEEGIMDKLKKLGLSATVIAALLASPQLTQAQKTPLQQLAKQQTTQTVSVSKTNPNFWVKDTNDIKRVQNLFKAYRWWTLAQWKINKAVIVDETKFYSQMTPAERKSIEARYMKDAPETEEDGKNGQFTSKFIFPGAFLEDLNTGNIANLGLEGNKALEIVNKVGISVDQMKDWNDFVKWMKEKGASGSPEMNRENYRNKILQQYTIGPK